MALTAEFQVALFEGRFPIVDADGRPTIEFLRALNAFVRVVNTQGDYLEAINAANAAADNANNAAAAAQNAVEQSASETSIVNSFVKDFVAPSPLQADSSGNVTIKNHTRQYGDQALNPDVAIAGGALATAGAAGQIARVYYDDPTRADTTPTFQFTLGAPPIQGGDRHVIGAVEIPASGTSDGGYVRPPGYTTDKP